MPFFEIRRTTEYKIISFCGLSIKLERSRLKKEKRLYEKVLSLRDDGVSLIANFNQNDGEANVAKSVLSAIRHSDIPYDHFELEGLKEPSFKTKITFTTSYHYKPSEYRNLSVLFWEFESGMLERRPYAFEGVSGVIAFSDFNRRYFQSIAPRGMPVYKLPYPLQIEKNPEKPANVRARYGLTEKDFVCFFNFSYLSSYYRKNPEAVLQAFGKAFPNEDDAKLLIKTAGQSKAPEMAEVFAKKIEQSGLARRIIVVNDDLPADQMYSLLNCCDVYISLHRGEGLGLGMLEAMGSGKPVIATNYGGNIDFTKKSIAFPVSYQLVAPQETSKDSAAYKYVQTWANPDIDEAASYLRQLYENPTLRREIGKKAEKYIADNFSPETFVEKLRSLL